MNISSSRLFYRKLFTIISGVEAAIRGWTIDLQVADITGVIQSLEEDDLAGQCCYSFFSLNHVVIDAAFWNRVPDRAREFIVFHELGHCELARAHREDAFADGTCKSIMRSGIEDYRDNYRPFTRADYLNELFDP